MEPLKAVEVRRRVILQKNNNKKKKKNNNNNSNSSSNNNTACAIATRLKNTGKTDRFADTRRLPCAFRRGSGQHNKHRKRGTHCRRRHLTHAQSSESTSRQLVRVRVDSPQPRVTLRRAGGRTRGVMCRHEYASSEKRQGRTKTDLRDRWCL